MASYTREQLETIRRIKRTPGYRNATTKQRKAALETVLVESNAMDVGHGDRDSEGAFQQRPSQGWGPASETLEQDADQFFAAARKADRPGMTSGQLSQAVQRSAFPDRYAQRSGEAAALLGGDSSPKYGVPAVSGKRPTLTPGHEETDTKGAVTAALLDKRKGMSLLSRMQEALASGKYTTTTLPKVTPGKYGVSPATNSQAAGGDVAARADAIDKKHLPYQWGGGHGGKVDAFNAAPLDCSGAVSAVLGINPRVSGEFTKWGKAGDGGSKGVTVYANGHHVLMKINGHFFGTSASNPGGGAGWIKQSNISPSYLAGFTARHA